MLTRLTITDFALLRKAEVYFAGGLTAITGETGAGKSLLVGAIGFLGGQKAPFGVVRDGARKAVVEGEFSRANGSVVILRREITADGRSRSFLDDEPASTRDLAESAAQLLDITSQRAFSRLLDSDRHLDFLDIYAGLTPDRGAMAQYESEFLAIERAIHKLQKSIDEHHRRRDFLTHQLREVEALAPEPGEDERLTAELRRLEHIEEIHQDGARISDLLTDDNDAVENKLTEVGRLMDRLSAFDPELTELASEVDSARSALREISRRVTARCRADGFEERALEEMRERQHRLAGLARRYGGSLTSALEQAESFRREISEGSSAEADLDSAREKRRARVAEWVVKADAVGIARREQAPRLAAAVVESLKELGVPQAKFEIRLVQTPDPDGLYASDGQNFRLTCRGAEDAEFYFSANAGIEPRPVVSVASGGELSRVMLALKESLPPGSDEASILFDEIDTGVSGRVARLVGMKLKALARGRQLFVITHLPQIASLADRHLKVIKRDDSGLSVTEVTELEGAERISELAAMISGGTVTEAAREQASLLLRDDL